MAKKPANINQGNESADESAQGSALAVHAQYIKDLSFEIGELKEVFGNEEQPNININVEVNANVLGEHDFEVELLISVSSKRKEAKVFVLELNYAGVFSLPGVEEKYRHPVVLIECPRLLFPFARSIVANVTRESGLPPLSLAPMDFAEIYRQQHMQQESTSAETSKDTDKDAE